MEEGATIGGVVLGISSMFARVPVVAQVEDGDGSKLLMTAPVNGVAVDSQAGIPASFLMGRSCPEKIETVSRH